MVKKTKPVKEAPKEEPKKEAPNMEEIINAITQKVVTELKPDLEKKMAALSQQIATEMQDIRTHIPQPQTYEQPPTENPQPPTANLIEQLLPLAQMFLRPAPVNPQQQELMNVFNQAMVRNQLAKMNTADFIQEEMVKKMTKDMFGTTVPDRVSSTNEHFMKPLRDIGNKKAQIPDGSENKQ